MLLIPEVVELDADERPTLEAQRDELAELGLIIEPFGPGAVARARGAGAARRTDIKGLVRDLADEICGRRLRRALKERLDASRSPWPATAACAPAAA